MSIITQLSGLTFRKLIFEGGFLKRFLEGRYDRKFDKEMTVNFAGTQAYRYDGTLASSQGGLDSGSTQDGPIISGFCVRIPVTSALKEYFDIVIDGKREYFYLYDQPDSVQTEYYKTHVKLNSEVRCVIDEDGTGIGTFISAQTFQLPANREDGYRRLKFLCAAEGHGDPIEKVFYQKRLDRDESYGTPSFDITVPSQVSDEGETIDFKVNGATVPLTVRWEDGYEENRGEVSITSSSWALTAQDKDTLQQYECSVNRAENPGAALFSITIPENSGNSDREIRCTISVRYEGMTFSSYVDITQKRNLTTYGFAFGEYTITQNALAIGSSSSKRISKAKIYIIRYTYQNGVLTGTENQYSSYTSEYEFTSQNLSTSEKSSASQSVSYTYSYGGQTYSLSKSGVVYKQEAATYVGDSYGISGFTLAATTLPSKGGTVQLPEAVGTYSKQWKDSAGNVAYQDSAATVSYSTTVGTINASRVLTVGKYLYADYLSIGKDRTITATASVGSGAKTQVITITQTSPVYQSGSYGVNFTFSPTSLSFGNTAESKYITITAYSVLTKTYDSGETITDSAQPVDRTAISVTTTDTNIATAAWYDGNRWKVTSKTNTGNDRTCLLIASTTIGTSTYTGKADISQSSGASLHSISLSASKTSGISSSGEAITLTASCAAGDSVTFSIVSGNGYGTLSSNVFTFNANTTASTRSVTIRAACGYATKDITITQNAYTASGGVWVESEDNEKWKRSTRFATKTAFAGYKIYESYSNKGVNNGIAQVKVKMSGKTSYEFWVHSYAQTIHDYVAVMSLDTEYEFGTNGSGYDTIDKQLFSNAMRLDLEDDVIETTKTTSTTVEQVEPTSISVFKKVTVTAPDTREHFVYVIYGKNATGNYNDDCGFIAIKE